MTAWLPIPGFPGYDVSDDGQVRSVRKVLRPFTSDHGYQYVSLRRDGQTYRRYVHRLVLTAFISEPPANADGCHNDGDPSNNHLDNLRWDSRSANVRDTVRHGRHNHASKTHCIRGHEFTEDNIYWRPGPRRQCVTCTKANSAETYARKKANA